MSPGETTRRFREFARRSHEVIVLAAITGAVTGFAVAAFDWLVVDVLLDHLFELSPWALAWMPLVGLALSLLALRGIGRTTDPGTADLYLKAFHHDDQRYRLREMPGRMIAAILTPGLGGAMGLEGGSLYVGSWFGEFLQRRFPRFTTGSNRRVLLVAGAAAGVAAIFKAPATGAIFALEVPYKEDLARRALLPALVSSAAGYLAFVSVNGTTPLFAAHGSQPPLSFADLAGALALGVAAGIGARGFAWLVLAAKAIPERFGAWTRVIAAGLTLAALFGITFALTDEPLSIGVGYHTIDWALDPDRALWLLAVVLVVRCLATAVTVGRWRRRRPVRPVGRGRRAAGSDRGRRRGRRPHHPLRGHRRRRLPRRRLPGALGCGHVRGRDDRPPRVRGPGAPRRGRRDAGDGAGVDHGVPTQLATRLRRRPRR